MTAAPSPDAHSDPRRPRTALYVPASAPRMLARAPSLGADAIVVDLEDSVASEAKTDARRAAVEALAGLERGRRLRVLRVNGAGTPWHAGDLAAAVDAAPDAVLLPKVGDVDALAELQDALDAAGAPDTVRAWAMLETLDAVLDAPRLARARDAAPRFEAFCVGNNDLAREAGLAIPTPRATLHPWLMGFVAAAKAGGVAVLDGVWNDYRDAAGFAADCAASAASGMDGRTLIHPSQIDVANAAFSPDDATVADARRTVAAFEDPANAGRGAISVDGRMLERLHLGLARRTLARADAIARADSDVGVGGGTRS